jgi:pimeloyl-ACP methyl ester carboxylesterase
MPVPVAMPRLGMSMREGKVVDWPVALGERVEKGQTVVVIESEKAEVEVEATAGGFLRHVYVEPDETVPCGTLLAALTESADEPFDAEAFAESHRAATPPAEAPAEAQAAARAPAPRGEGEGEGRTAAARRGRGRRPVAPAARALARQLGLDVDDPALVPGTGPGGRVTRADVEDAARRRESLVRVDEGVSLEVLRDGDADGEPVLFLPGFAADASAFSFQAQSLARARGFAVLAPNPRGVGLSDAPDLGRYEVETAARDAAAVLEQTAGPAHVVGASLGAAIALELALAEPARVRSLTLVTPFLEATPRLLAVTEACVAAARAAGEAAPETLARVLLPWLFSPRDGGVLAEPALRERTLRGLAAMLARVPAATLARSAAGLAAWSGKRRSADARVLGDHRIPVLVLAGADDLLTPDAAAVAEALPDARLETIAGAGHALTSDAPEAVNELLGAHLRAQSASRAG